MLFNLENDVGAKVTGYLVPDGYEGVPRIRVCCAGEELFVFSCNESRDALVQAGRHQTGQCGFCIDEGALPNLQTLAQLELYEAESGVMIYRRRAPHMAARKILRLETHLLPLWRLDEALKPSFQYHARGVEALGRETVTQLFLLNAVDSVYISGRLLYKNYAYFVEAGFLTAILLQDPYEELAERLMVLSKVRKVGGAFLGMRESMGLEPAFKYAESLPYDDDRALKRALRAMPPEVGALFANPLTRQLTSATPDQMPNATSVSAALDTLASFALVGVRHDLEKFLSAFAELIGVEPSLLPVAPQIPSVRRLAAIIRDSRHMEAILDRDLELFHHVREAHERTA
jgi:hypothetical protein